MSLENLIATMLSVDFIFGASMALAFERGIRELVGGLLDTAGDEAEAGSENESA